MLKLKGPGNDNLKIDKSNFRKVILDFPLQFKAGIERAEKIAFKNGFERILICGMGGSALAGEILKMYFKNSKIKIPLFLHRDYNLPFQVDKKDLIVAISYSGNTEETISSFNEALRRKLKVAAITSGGKLAQLCQKNEIPLVLIPTGIPPRSALGYLFAALLKILINCQILPDVSEEILILEKTLHPKKLENSGKKLAQKLKNKIPLIYASCFNFPLAKIWKIKFNENSKIPAFANFFPELNHNEMVGFSEISNFQIPISNFYVLILKDLKDHLRILKRMDLTAEILKKRGVKVENIYLQGKNFFSKIFSNLLLADWVSYYLALNYKIDPRPVKIVEEFKKKMELSGPLSLQERCPTAKEH